MSGYGDRVLCGAPKLIGSDTTKHGGGEREGRRPGRSREGRDLRGIVGTAACKLGETRVMDRRN